MHWTIPLIITVLIIVIIVLLTRPRKKVVVAGGCASIGPVTPPQVKCDKCKHYVDRYDAQEIKLDGMHSLFYCPDDRVAYERASRTIAGYRFFKEFETDEKGAPLGFRAIKGYKPPRVTRRDPIAMRGFGSHGYQPEGMVIAIGHHGGQHGNGPC